MPPQDNPIAGPTGTQAPWNPTRQQLDQLEQILQRMMKDQQPPTQTNPMTNWPPTQGGQGFGVGIPGQGPFPGQQAPYQPSNGHGQLNTVSGNSSLSNQGNHWAPPPNSSSGSMGIPHQGNPFGGLSQPFGQNPTQNWAGQPGSWNPSSTTWGPLAESWKQNPGGIPLHNESTQVTSAAGSTTTGTAIQNRERPKTAIQVSSPEISNENGITWLMNLLVDLPLSAFGAPGRFFMGPTGRFLLGGLGLGMISYAGLILASDWLDWSWADQLLPWQLVGRIFPPTRL